jgi:hypothetical protein
MARFSEQQQILKGPRARARRHFLLKTLLSVGVMVVILGGGTYAAIATGVLTVRALRVEGVRLADHDKVTSALAETMGARIPLAWFGRDSMLFWLFAEPPEPFLAAFPMFREVDISPDIIAREVAIRAIERELYGVWCLAGGICYAFDDDGIIFGQAPGTFGTLITKVTDVRTAPFSAGEVVLPDAEWRAHLLHTLAILRALRLTPRVITVREPALREWEVTLAEGPILKFSFTFVPERLDEALTTLSRRDDFRALTYLDFRVRDRLYYK